MIIIWVWLVPREVCPIFSASSSDDDEEDDPDGDADDEAMTIFGTGGLAGGGPDFGGDVTGAGGR